MPQRAVSPAYQRDQSYKQRRSQRQQPWPVAGNAENEAGMRRVKRVETVAEVPRQHGRADPAEREPEGNRLVHRWIRGRG